MKVRLSFLLAERSTFSVPLTLISMVSTGCRMMFSTPTAAARWMMMPQRSTASETRDSSHTEPTA